MPLQPNKLSLFLSLSFLCIVCIFVANFSCLRPSAVYFSSPFPICSLSHFLGVLAVHPHLCPSVFISGSFCLCHAPLGLVLRGCSAPRALPWSVYVTPRWGWFSHLCVRPLLPFPCIPCIPWLPPLCVHLRPSAVYFSSPFPICSLSHFLGVLAVHPHLCPSVFISGSLLACHRKLKIIPCGTCS
jgi:hypothetical protein